MKRRRPPRRYLRTQCNAPSWCADCGVNTTQCTISRRRRQRRCPRHYGDEFYMVHQALWDAAVPEDAAAPGMTLFLCIGCLETRVGRRLTPADFSDVSLNDDSPADSMRLRDRKRTT